MRFTIVVSSSLQIGAETEEWINALLVIDGEDGPTRLTFKEPGVLNFEFDPSGSLVGVAEWSMDESMDREFDCKSGLRL
jgi:hypothetical protein